MAVSKQFIQSFMAFSLLVALMLPLSIQLSHSYEKHEHTVCSDETTVHFHEADQDCSAFHFNLQTFNFEITSDIEIIEVFNNKAVDIQFKFVLHSTIINLPQLRGPPSILS